MGDLKKVTQGTLGSSLAWEAHGAVRQVRQVRQVLQVLLVVIGW